MSVVVNLAEMAPLLNTVIVTISAAVAFAALRRTVRSSIDGQLTNLNEAFCRLEVCGPIVTELFPDKPEDERLRIQKKVVTVLNCINYFRSYWSAYHNSPLWVFRLLSDKDWKRCDDWFRFLIWPWIEKDAQMMHVIRYLLKSKDYQEDGFAAHLNKFLLRKGGEDYTKI